MTPLFIVICRHFYCFNVIQICFGKSFMCKIKPTVKNSNYSIRPGYSFSLLDVTGNRKMVRQCFLARFLMEINNKNGSELCTIEGVIRELCF